MSALESDVASHYSVDDLIAKIDAGLAALGIEPHEATAETLAPVDEFHTAGRVTTLKTIALSGLANEEKRRLTLLDAGCGIGGTARTLSEELDADVTGIDLTPEYIEVATILTARMGMAERVRFETGSVTLLPMADASFDGAFTFHVGMNVEDRAAFYSEVARVLRPGGTFCLFDVLKGPNAGMCYPVPWAETQATSFLKSQTEMRALIDNAGLTLTAEENLSAFAAGFFEKAFAAMKKSKGPPPLGLHLLMGSNSAQKFQNYAAALGDDQVEPTIMVARKEL